MELSETLAKAQRESIVGELVIMYRQCMNKINDKHIKAQAKAEYEERRKRIYELLTYATDTWKIPLDSAELHRPL